MIHRRNPTVAAVKQRTTVTAVTAMARRNARVRLAIDRRPTYSPDPTETTTSLGP